MLLACRWACCIAPLLTTRSSSEVALASFPLQETGVAGSRPSGTPFGWFGFGYPGTFGEAQTDDKAPGDIGGDVWQRYDDPEVKAFKLNAERNNGRAAMLGITGCLIHELLGVDALYPTGGLSGAAPPTIFS